jgi:hypothetical protein
MEKYTKEQFWKLYEKLPQELKDAVFAEETAENIYSICEKNEIENVPKVSSLVSHVLLGLLLPDEFQGILEKELKLKSDVAKKISHEINRFIFFPVRSSLEMLHKTEITPSAKPTIPPSLEISPEISTPSETPVSPKPPSEEESEKPEKPDVYREMIE